MFTVYLIKKCVSLGYRHQANTRYVKEQLLKKPNFKKSSILFNWFATYDKHINIVYADTTRYKRKQRYKYQDKKIISRLKNKKLSLKNVVYDDIQQSLNKLFNGLTPNPYRYGLNFKRYIMFKFKNKQLQNMYLQFIPQISFKTVKRRGQRIRSASKPNIKKSHSLIRRWLKKGCQSRKDRHLKTRIIKELSQPQMSFRCRSSDISQALNGLAIL